MNEKECLNEDKNKKTSKKLKAIAFLIFTIAIIIGGTIIFNSIKTNNYNNSKEGINSKLEIDKQIGKLEDEQSEELRKNSKSDKYYEIEYKIEELEEQKKDLERDLLDGVPVGAFIICVGLVFSSTLFFAANMRNIQAYQVQQLVPVAQETAEKMAPIVGVVAQETAEKMAPIVGVVAKEVAKGIKKGLEDEEK